MRILFLFLMASLFISCGPMNSRPPVKHTNVDREAFNATTNNKFIVFAVLANSQPDFHIGDNEIIFRIINSTDGTPLSNAAKVEVQCQRVKGTVAKATPLPIQKQTDGFHTLMSVKKQGEWNIILKITDNNVEDDVTLTRYFQ